MKKNLKKRMLAVVLAAVMTIGCMVGCGDSSSEGNAGSTSPTNEGGTAVTDEGSTAATVGGTIMWLSNQSSGYAYEAAVVYLTALCDKLGYKLTVVYGDPFNDAAGNLSAVKNGMTSDVVGLITSQDGGLLSIMEEYPDMFVAGYNTDMYSVYGEGGENAACLENDHFLGTIVDGYANGEDTAKDYFDIIVEKGYKKVAIVNFPSYAYPMLGVATETIPKLVEEYNASASDEDKIEIVGDVTTLEFAPMEDSWFLEDGRDDLDCIIGFCSGTTFIFPALTSAIANGTCSPDTKLITGGFDADEAITSFMGEGDDKIISAVIVSVAENPAYAMVLLDNAINGKQYADWTNESVDSFPYLIDTEEEVENVMTKTMVAELDASLAQLSVDDVANLCLRNNPDATYADLIAALHDENTISAEALANK